MGAFQAVAATSVRVFDRAFRSDTHRASCPLTSDKHLAFLSNNRQSGLYSQIAMNLARRLEKESISAEILFMFNASIFGSAVTKHVKDQDRLAEFLGKMVLSSVIEEKKTDMILSFTNLFTWVTAKMKLNIAVKMRKQTFYHGNMTLVNQLIERLRLEAEAP